MENLPAYARRLDQAAATLPLMARAVAAAGPAPAALGAEGPGRLADVGRALHEHLSLAAAARGREADDLAARMTETAAALRTIAEGYADTDTAARRRQPEPS
nr:hypothetical protein [Micromonospora sp. DSM 115978]